MVLCTKKKNKFKPARRVDESHKSGLKEASNVEKLKAFYGPKFDKQQEALEEDISELDEDKDYLVVPGDLGIAKELSANLEEE